MEKLLLFDIDGTLVRMKAHRSRTMFITAFEEAFTQSIPPELLGDFAGRTDTYILTDISTRLNIDLSEEDIAYFFTVMQKHFREYSHVDHIDILPGVNDLLNHLSTRQDILLMLVTGNIKECAYMKLAPFSLDSFFVDGAFGDISSNRNDLPCVAVDKANSLRREGNFLHENIVIVGDTPFDIDCAYANNLKVLTVGTGGYSCEELQSLNPTRHLPSFSDLAVSLQTIEECFG